MAYSLEEKNRIFDDVILKFAAGDSLRGIFSDKNRPDFYKTTSFRCFWNWRVKHTEWHERFDNAYLAHLEAVLTTVEDDLRDDSKDTTVDVAVAANGAERKSTKQNTARVLRVKALADHVKWTASILCARKYGSKKALDIPVDIPNWGGTYENKCKVVDEALKSKKITPDQANALTDIAAKQAKIDEVHHLRQIVEEMEDEDKKNG